MPALMHKTENIKCIAFDLVVEEVGKWPALAARKAVRTGVISALPLHHDSNRLLNPIMEIFAKTLRCFGIMRFSVQELLLEERAENDVHAFSPKTSSNDRPRSLPDRRSARRDRNAADTSSSFGPPGFTLSSNSFASCSRCSAGKERASSAK